MRFTLSPFGPDGSLVWVVRGPSQFGELVAKIHVVADAEVEVEASVEEGQERARRRLKGTARFEADYDLSLGFDLEGDRPFNEAVARTLDLVGDPQRSGIQLPQMPSQWGPAWGLA